ncbi:MAG: ABC transporter substrate-binding protein [Deltaproteobacteria bacterium]|nr:ABC transporter substrate-binding protein [Deltaproteobacteria bacterium]
MVKIFSALAFFAVCFSVFSLGYAQQSAGRPEKKTLDIAVAAFAHTTMPLLIAHEAGYFAKYGVTVNISAVSASVAVQGLISGKIDIYQGGSAAMMAALAGADIIYVAAGVDKSSLILFGQRGITSLENLRGKTVATTSPGAFGDIAMRMSARKSGMEIPRDIKLMFHGTPAQAFQSFTLNHADGMINTPPQTDLAKQKGYPIIIDYYKEGLKIIGPGTAVTREFTQKNPNTVRAFLMGLLEGVKRAIDDEEYASKLESKYSKVTDPKILADNYQQGLRVWNKDLTIDPAAIRIVLENTPDGKGKDADPKRFYDNSFIQAINRDFASKLFPGEVK